MKTGLYSNINAKKKRIAAGSGEKMNKVGSKAAPTAADFKQAAKTAKKTKKVK
jgi:signal recognition particle GTPase